MADGGESDRSIDDIGREVSDFLRSTESLNTQLFDLLVQEPRPLRRFEALASWLVVVMIMIALGGPLAYFFAPRYTTLEGFENLSESFGTVGSWVTLGALAVPFRSRQLRKSFEPTMAEEGFGYFVLHTAFACSLGGIMWLGVIRSALIRRAYR